MGVLAEEAVAVFKEVSALPNIKVHSVSTHLPVSNEDEQFTREELHNFGKLIKQLRVEVPGDYKANGSIANSRRARFRGGAFNIRASRDADLRHFVVAGISKPPTSGDGLENVHRAHS